MHSTAVTSALLTALSSCLRDVASVELLFNVGHRIRRIRSASAGHRCIRGVATPLPESHCFQALQRAAARSCAPKLQSGSTYAQSDHGVATCCEQHAARAEHLCTSDLCDRVFIRRGTLCTCGCPFSMETVFQIVYSYLRYSYKPPWPLVLPVLHARHVLTTYPTYIYHTCGCNWKCTWDKAIKP